MKKITCSIIVLTLLNGVRIDGQTSSPMVTLGKCINAALNYNPLIKQSSDELRQAALAVKISEAALYPVILTESTAGYSNEYRINNNYKTGTVSISGEQVLWQNGRLKANIEQSRYSLNAEDFSLEVRKLDIIAGVKTAYFSCLMFSQLYKTASDNISNAALFLEYAKERYKTGTGRKSDILKAENDLSEAQFESESFRNSLLRTRNELSLLTGLSSESLSDLEEVREQYQSDYYEEAIDTLMAEATRNYPELKIVNYRQLAQRAKIRQVTAELYPAVGISTGYNWSYNPVFQEQNGWYTLLTVRWKLFSGNENRLRIKTEMARNSFYDNRKNEVNDYLQKEIKNRLINLREAIRQIRLTDLMLITTSENLEIAKAQYKEGIGSILELTIARTDGLNAKQKNIRAIADFNFALVNLERLTKNINQY
jgi:outer membrane protein